MDVEIWKYVTQWTGIGGVAVLSVTLIYRVVIGKDIFPKLKRDQAYLLLLTIVVASLIIALAGFATHAYVVYVEKSSNTSPPNVTNNTTLDLSDRWRYEDRSNHDTKIFVTPPVSAPSPGNNSLRPATSDVQVGMAGTTSRQIALPQSPTQVTPQPAANPLQPQPRRRADAEAQDEQLEGLYRALHGLKEEGYELARKFPNDLNGGEQHYLGWKGKVLDTLGSLDAHLKSHYDLDTHFEEDFNDTSNQLMNWSAFAMIPNGGEQSARSFRTCATHVEIYKTKSNTELMQSRR